jgi:hypothetical protein
MRGNMSYLHPTVRARINAQITTKELQLAAANTAYTAALENAEVQGYVFDSGEGKQATTRRKPAEIRKEITQLENEINALYARLSGTGVCTMNLRRRP